MSYLNAFISQVPAYGWQSGPEFNTRIVTMKSGRERRNAEWGFARHTFTVPFKNITQAAYIGIKQMHLVCRGQLHCFKFKDYLDCTSTNEIFATGDGVKTVFQLCKISVIDGVSYERDCFVILPGFAITDNGTSVAPTVDTARGLVTFSVAPGAGDVLRWSGTFAVWVRFNHDQLPFSLDDLNAVNGSVDLIEVPPPP